MNENALNLYCPHCKRVSEVVTEAGQFVCVECGWQVGKDISSKLLNPQSGTPTEIAGTAPLATPLASAPPNPGAVTPHPSQPSP
jgi:predicted RNA-binding Zn-ribbon protein involved in translation (DUF1610 family)